MGAVSQQAGSRIDIPGSVVSSIPCSELTSWRDASIVASTVDMSRLASNGNGMWNLDWSKTCGRSVGTSGEKSNGVIQERRRQEGNVLQIMSFSYASPKTPYHGLWEVCPHLVISLVPRFADLNYACHTNFPGDMTEAPGEGDIEG